MIRQKGETYPRDTANRLGPGNQDGWPDGSTSSRSGMAGRQAGRNRTAGRQQQQRRQQQQQQRSKDEPQPTIPRQRAKKDPYMQGPYLIQRCDALLSMGVQMRSRVIKGRSVH
jgi:hypothetical protein